MNNSLKTLTYTILFCIIIFVVVKLFIIALPFLLLAGVITWIVYKIYSFYRTKKYTESKNDDYNKTYSNNNEKDDTDTSKAIDVDYKDVD
jgi:Ca2+/Na+ antiporter